MPSIYAEIKSSILTIKIVISYMTQLGVNTRSGNAYNASSKGFRLLYLTMFIDLQEQNRYIK